MKIRIASSIALAAALALGATGCSLIAPQGTLEQYAPSDGVSVNVGGVNVRNILLIADETGENFNVVFTAVNRTGEEQDLAVSFTGAGSSDARAEFTVPKGNTAFGDPEGEQDPVLVTLSDLRPGQTAEAYFQVPGASEEAHKIPVLDGTLEDYRRYVLPANFADDEDADTAKTGSESASTGPKAGEALEEEDQAASQSDVGNPETE